MPDASQPICSEQSTAQVTSLVAQWMQLGRDASDLQQQKPWKCWRAWADSLGCPAKFVLHHRTAWCLTPKHRTRNSPCPVQFSGGLFPDPHRSFCTKATFDSCNKTIFPVCLDLI